MSTQTNIKTPEEVQNMLKKNFKNTKQCLDEIILGRKELLVILSQERNKLDKLDSYVKKCKVFGGVAGAVGTGLVVAGLAASFFTFGASLMFSIVGSGMGASGAVVASGASIADAVISKKKRKIINNLLERDAELIKRLKLHLTNTYECLDEIILGRKELLVILSQEREELNKLASDVQICKVSGGVAGIVGTGLVIGGFVASFFTFGASLAVSLAGAGVGASGAIVATGASIADAVISKNKRKIINDLLEKDAELIKRFECSYEDLKIAYQFVNVAKTVAFSTKTIVTNAIRLVKAADIAVDASRTVFGALRGTAKVFAIAGAVFLSYLFL